MFNFCGKIIITLKTVWSLHIETFLTFTNKMIYQEKNLTVKVFFRENRKKKLQGKTYLVVSTINFLFPFFVYYLY